MSGGSSPRSSRASIDPNRPIAAATGVGKISAAESSSGKLRLNAMDTFVGTGSISATATARAHTTGVTQSPSGTSVVCVVNACANETNR